MLPILAAAIAAAYALVFWLIAWKSPKFALISVFALAPFQNDLSVGGPVRFSIAEINLLLALPVFILRRRPFSLGPLALPALCYFGICVLSSALSWRPDELASLIQIAIYLGVVVAVFRSFPANTLQYRAPLLGLVGVCAFIAAVAIMKRTGYVLGLHKNGSGASLACGAIVCTELWLAERNRFYRCGLLAALLLIGSGLVFTLSRGAWMTAVCGVTLILLMRRQFLLMLKAALALIPLAVICWYALPQESRNNASALDRESFNIRARYDSMDYALAVIHEHPIIGAGVGLRKEYDATNIILLTLAETGAPGLLALVSIHLALLWMVWKGQRIIPRSHRDSSLLAIATALAIGKMAHGVVDHYWGRGDTMIVWASAGMAVRACSLHKRQRKRKLAASKRTARRENRPAASEPQTLPLPNPQSTI